MNEAEVQIGRLNQEKQEYLKKYFSDAPDWLMDEFRVIRFPSGTTFIEEGDPADTVCLLLKGKVLAVDYRVKEMAYGFCEFQPLEVFGTMEILIGKNHFQTTLMTTKDSTLLKIGREKFEKWIRSDLNAFQMEAERISRYLVEQARNERLKVLLQGAERVYLVLLKMYEIYAVGDHCSIYMSRKGFAETTGLSERTISRILKDLEQKSYIARSGWNIIISKEQYLKMKALIADKMNGTGE
jgi:CRP/FNR family cyclic AMP-dependent transcriptional regulator